MNELDPKYKEFQDKTDKLIAENKKLRLRPSLHSSEANIFEFMNTKSSMAEAMLSAKDIKKAIDISLIYLSKITNIHSIIFFKKTLDTEQISIANHKGCPKKFLSEFSDPLDSVKYDQLLFSNEITYHYTNKHTHNQEFLLDKYLEVYQTKVVLPIIKNESSPISLLFLSKKEFEDSRYFKTIISNIQAQLRSSFIRILYQEQIVKQAEKLEESIRTRVSDYEKINRELRNQVHESKKQIEKLNEKLNLYHGIVEKSNNIILRINKDGHILFHNTAFKQLSFIKGKDKNNLLCYFGEGDFPGLEQMQDNLEKGFQNINYKIQVQLKAKIWFMFSFTPIKNKKGLIMEIQVSGRNIDFTSNQYPI